MKYFLALYLFLTFTKVSFSQTVPVTVNKNTSTRFLSGDTITLKLISYGCFDPGNTQVITFVRHAECVTVTRKHINNREKEEMVTDRMEIRYQFLADTLFRLIKGFKKLDNGG